MKKHPTDFRTIENWLKKVEEKEKRENLVTFFTLSSLTPDKISSIIESMYIDPDNPEEHELLREHAANAVNDNMRIRPDDYKDNRLITIILFVINEILMSVYYKKKTFQPETRSVIVPTSFLQAVLYDKGTVISQALFVARFCEILNIQKGAILGENSEARGYMIHPHHLNNRFNDIRIVDCPDPKIAKKIGEHRKNRIEQQRWKLSPDKGKVYYWSLYNVFQLRLDNEAGLEGLNKEYEKRISELPISTTRKYKEKYSFKTLESVRMWYFSSLTSVYRLSSNKSQYRHQTVDDFGRVHTNLTNFPKCIRHLLTFQGCGESMAMVDMSNAQPFLMVFLIMRYFTTVNKRKIDTRDKLARYCQKNGLDDVMRYVRVVENGAFYKECYRLFMRHKRIKEITPEWKEAIRKMIYTSQFYGDGHTKWRAAKKLKALFKQEYPTVNEIMEGYKKDDYKKLSQLLQQEESKLFIEDVLTKLIVKDNRPYILSLHDGIFCPESAVEFVMSKFEDSFSESKFQVRFKIEHYSTGKSEIRTINPVI